MNPGPQSPSTDGAVYFYPPEFYVFDNFSSFQLEFEGKVYPTSEHAYQSIMFNDSYPELAEKIRLAPSAHDAMKLAQESRNKRRTDWDEVKLSIMKKFLRAKVLQHPYVLNKLKESGNRIIIEDSWRDSYWGWGADQSGENMLGKCWQEVRSDLKKEGIL